MTPGEELRELLAPVTPQTFVREYWGKRPLFIKGHPEKFAGLFDMATLSNVLSAPGPVPPDFLRVSFDRKTDAGTSAAPRTRTELTSAAFRATPDQAPALFDAGATLCVSQIETRVKHLQPFLAAVKRQLGYSGRISFNAYLSPARSGFNWHFDSRIASTLQIEGSKRWRFSHAPAMAWPRANGSLRGDGTALYADPNVRAQPWERFEPFNQNEVTEVLIEPGDLLILPAGVWHEACGGESGSLALNLSFTPISYTTLISRLLDSLLVQHAEWRSPAPLLPDGELGEVDADGRALLGAELARAAQALQSLSADSAEVVKVWQSFVQNVAVDNESPSDKEAPPVQPTERLRLRLDGNFSATLADDGSRLCIAIGADRSLELTGATLAFVQQLLVERVFVAGDCVHWANNGTPFTWNDVQTTLTALKREGLIEANLKVPAP